MDFTWFGRTSGDDCPPRRIDNHTFLLVASGRGTFRTAGRTFALGPGDLFVLLPDRIHEYRPDPSDPWSLLWFGIQGKDVGALVAQSGIRPDRPVLSQTAREGLLRIFQDILSLLESGRTQDRLLAMGRFLELLGLLCGALVQEIAAAPEPAERIRRVLLFMNDNYSFDLDAETLARRAGYTRTHFSRIFRESVGTAPMQHLRELRLSKAQALLVHTSLSIKEVGYSVGFRDPLYFSKVYRRRFGRPPTQARKAAMPDPRPVSSAERP